MRFLKFSIVILFLLSLLSASVTVFLSTIRENEKEKRIYLEQVRSELEERIQTLESEKSELERRVTDLEFQNQDLAGKLKAEQEARVRATNVIRRKDDELQSMREELDESEKAFSNAQKRNRELEQILDQLEVRLREMESRISVPGPEVGFVEMNVNPTQQEVSKAPIVEVPSSFIKQVPLEREPFVQEPVQEMVKPQVVSEPQATSPKPPKERRFFPFLRSSKAGEKEREEVSVEAMKEAAPVVSQEKLVVQEPTRPLPQFQSVTPEFKPTVRTSQPFVAPSSSAGLREEQKTQLTAREGKAVTAGRVLLINRKFNFVVTNLGTKQGLIMGGILRIQRNGVEVAKVRVEKLYDDYSAAYIIEEQSESAITEGDVITAF